MRNDSSWVRRVPSLAAVIGMLLALGCGGAEKQKTSTPAPPVDVPERTAAENPDLRALIRQIVAHEACSKLSGSYLGLTSSQSNNGSDAGPAEGGAEVQEQASEGSAPVAGRLWIEHCHASLNESDELEISLKGRGWQWIDRNKSKLGAKLKISQYVRFSAQVELVAAVDLAYAPDEHVLTVWVTPIEHVEAKLKPTGHVEVNPAGVWGELFGAGAAVFTGKGLDQRAEKNVKKKGSKKLSSRLGEGFSIAFDLCTTQVYTKIGMIEEGELPEPPVDAGSRQWEQNKAAKLQPVGIDIAGPWASEPGRPLRAEVIVDEGGPVQAQLVCATEAAKLASAFLGDEQLPKVGAKAKRLVSAGKPVTLEAPNSDCALALVTRPAGPKPEPARFRYLAWLEGNRTSAIVPCDNQD